jgi:uncharacterized protein involved in outer membrane biogenesis
MRRKHIWLTAAAIVLLLLGLVWVLLLVFVPSDAELADYAAAEFESATGVKLTIDTLHWQLLPLPSVTVEGLKTDQKQPITLRRATVYPDLGMLLHKRIRLNSASVEGAVVPQLSVRELGANKDKATDKPETDDIPLGHFSFRDLTYVSRRGIAVVYDGDIDFDPHWRPHSAQLSRPGFTPATNLDLQRIGTEDRWTARIHLGGGTANGEVQMRPGKGGQVLFTGQLKLQGVEVQNALSAFNRRSVVSGKAAGDTVLTASGADFGEVVQSLHSKTVFSMAPATVLRFDLDKAIRTAGKDHAGQTLLDSLTGQMDTQNGPDGILTTYTNLKAHSGALTASGQATLTPDREVNAEFAVDLVDGLVGVPLKITGPLSAIKVSVPGGAVAGAVIGTAVLPGIGTVIGARVGATLGKLFGGSPDPAARASAPARPASRPARAKAP